MTHLVESFQNHFYIGLFVLLLIDTIGLPIPSELPLLYGGYLIYLHKITIVPAAFLAAAGALVGSLIAYVVSRSVGRAVVLRWGKKVLITEEHLHRSERWFEKRGPAAVFFCRMIPLARTLISIPAGIAEMEPIRFGVYSFLGSLPWAFALLGAGWALGSSYKKIEHSFTLVSIIVAVIIVAGIVWWFVRRRRAAAADVGS
jgi:membrane protein DedA with SNARE-associated domain